uniref:Probable threonine--tRNA ligase, cytoplasmic n=1 Tax=Corethron hystrix TaxID=216773 RepID=A0A7S1B9N5_9STRA|mmetsp:Transcript_18048/g.41052  ORF Transcript_18048/g.41052 Transcript_18048/m.41052 type:complete len:739 (+) Transcript_18048:142-2358(+)|eukprot:CAMPEP_0113304014 /NCGR_PEP_ID=MMETSP0010_2-20120614/4184_1 /TAXON_ID=216773 ORGANISM="Corethron hystrix, Strain 308" /NCGR_SAMPLE_ID=MMETSP0010_2 /ASSEMBLY_ACC=CAM_ASM_000155 /LENGTH=738 /DNA_ID=CAMNT_0000158095 /DNA_START=1140 /DNA_END=3356 /DNA_ORIENTATION=- /assembly_acc=CAM_ASM_000155
MSNQGTRTTASTGNTIKQTGSVLIANPFVSSPRPTWMEKRDATFEVISARRAEELATKVPVDVTVTLPDGKTVPAKSWQTTPYDVAASISQGLADSVVVARVNYSSYVMDYDAAEDGVSGNDPMMDETPDDKKGKDSILWDMNRPLVGDCTVEFLKFNDSPEAQSVFWHSSAHILGEALERLFGAHLTIGPPLAGGFYYDSYLGLEGENGAERTLKEDDYKIIEKEVTAISKAKQRFQRLVVTKEEALELLSYNPFKAAIIQAKVPDGTRTSVYKNGDLIDLCRGPHVIHTGKIKAFVATRHSATQWLGNVKNDPLQRLYGISFPDKKQMKEWKENQEKAKARDHRRIGIKQELFMFHDYSPGSCFFLPHGTRIYNKLVDFIKKQYWLRGYDEVITPNVFNLELWNQSGHALHYRDGMFLFDVEGQEWGMKPMNCPAHCLMFASRVRSHRELPLRLGDFGVLHRNELSGALTGLTRVRRFAQDDGHIFCRNDQIEEEVFGALDFMKYVYDIFGMSYKLELSTRPEKGLGDKALWDTAEAALARAMNDFAGEGGWKVNPGDGAFYGPKIDIKVMDAMGRVHQCATIQLDFQLPIRFDLKYDSADKEFARPVIVHRAMLGSVERMFAVLTEHYGGKWPFWLSPRQVMVIPVHADWNEYCEKVQKMMHAEGFYCDVDLSKAKFPKKVRNAQIAQYNFQLVVGEAEVTGESVNIRTRENKVEGEMKLVDWMEKCKKLRDEHQ